MTAEIIEFPPSSNEIRENAEEAYASLTERLQALQAEGYRDTELALAVVMLAKDIHANCDAGAYESIDAFADEILADADNEPLEVE